MSVHVKICGLQEETGLNAAVAAGARYVGFVFCDPSRHRLTAEQARPLALHVPAQVQSVGLFVDPTDDELRAVTEAVPLNILQLHGHETPQRVMAVRAATGLPVMKTIHIATADDLAVVPAYEATADLLLFDTKLGPQPSGGTGVAFDWSLLKGRRFAKPWMLAGGLKTTNLAAAVAATGAPCVDVSSGVEDGAGHKSPEIICAFLSLAAGL